MASHVTFDNVELDGDAVIGEVSTLRGEVHAYNAPYSDRSPHKIVLYDGTGFLTLAFFRADGRWLQGQFPIGKERVVSGMVEEFNGERQMTHPDHIVDPAKGPMPPAVEPIYGLTAGLTNKRVHSFAVQALDHIADDLPEWADPDLVKARGWLSFKAALSCLHAPIEYDPELFERARERLAYDEALARESAFALARASRAKRAAPSVPVSAESHQALLRALPYKPTGAQTRAFEQIAADMSSTSPMRRMLQGDVGAGKTLVAFMALLRAVEAGGQGVLMAPTEILARQHLEGLRPLAEQAGVVLELLTGRDKGPERRAKLSALESGAIQILVGTHAVFQADVAFGDLRLAVVDEQHRFGVRQRLELGKKGQAVDVLVMTATPIPRSLALAQYGDMDVSVLDEKPPGRKPIRTALIATDRMEEVVTRLRAAISEGRQCYWVCPLVEESEVSDLIAAEARFKHLRAALGEGVVGLVHGQMPPADKDAAMRDFQQGQTKLLVATTVIEVGVDVPNASIIVIERAESFGLAQLHQLRGRVGRGQAASTCLLMYQAPLSESGRQRLEVLRESEDGFVIAETDLKMRGTGDLIGTAQSGVPRFRVADLEKQAALMQVAQSDARALLAVDPDLITPRGKAARLLLWLMRQDEAIRLISVG
ncbi:ATP-dependent DNA helicase RecG [uncultured Sulfitobacter sp.]|uniref:ATP-dependent DNA helicase RecG n=1 Tax=uncultured Sulfitobacter sp. TaxID=191468 RepID=UPI002594874C|nr:ATP-dependent DNA helicase RecG [uncultured Sulfitobacter sp.]